MDKKIIFSSTKQRKLVSKSFLVTGVSFALICLIGYVSSIIVDSAGLLKGLDTTKTFDLSIYRTFGRLARLSLASGVLLIISIFLSVWWNVRFMRVSKTFMHVAFGVYILAQGFAFGTLFAVWNIRDIIWVFGLGGTLFGIMGFVGYYSRDLSSWGRLLFIYSFVVLFCWLISYVLILIGFINARASYSMMTLAFGILFLGYTAYDVWLLKKTAQWRESIGDLDQDTEYRIILFFGYRLLVDLVGLIWVMARYWLLSSSD